MKIVLEDLSKDELEFIEEGFFYRFDSENYDIEDIISVKHNIDKDIVEVYSEETKFDFSGNFTYSYDSETVKSINNDLPIIYKLVPNGIIFRGYDGNSINICQNYIDDYIKKNGSISESARSFIINMNLEKYVKNEKFPMSIVCQSYTVIDKFVRKEE